MKLAFAVLLLGAVAALLAWVGSTVRDTIERGTGTSRDQLVMRQRLALIGVLAVPGGLGGIWLLGADVRRFWWLFALGAIQVPLLIISTLRLRKEERDR